jgi:hypothetical protein
MLGTGGTSCLPRGVRPPGDGDRNVRSLMEPTLGLLCSLPLPRSRPAGEDSDEARRCTLFEGTSATFVGGLDCARKAAAAAAEDNEGWAVEWPRMKADAAAVAAVGSAVSFVRG